MRRAKNEANEEHANVLSSLSNYEKKSTQLPYDELPLEVCCGDHLNFSPWTLVMADKCLCNLAEDYKTRGLNSVKTINLSFGEKITDDGLYAIADSFSQISTAILENMFRVTEKGLLYLVKSCRNLCTVSLSGCLGISGAGFAIFGQYSHQLKILKLTGCSKVTPWAFMKIFEGCVELEELDVSYCSLITDQEIKLLSDHCKSLMNLNLKDCQQVSDIGIFSLSQGCKDLRQLNLARGDLASRITDVSLMAIGGGCNDLTSLNLSGCEMITDAGISWLSKGCPQLNYINLSNCKKITNGGMRCLGEDCAKLKTAVLTNAKKISDIGLRYLADGCDFLEHLNASGLYMLSDGSKRNFSFEGIQSIGKSKCCQTMKKINFHGCFQVGKLALQSLIEMENLEVLVLSSCKALSLEGMSCVTKTCSNISSLSLASCGECVTNTMLEDIAQNLNNLKILNLMGCGKVGRRGLKSLSMCIFLNYLNLSGCKAVTNDAILSLCDNKFSPGLRSLNLVGCHKINNTALGWITEGLRDKDGVVAEDITLVNLSFKGTK